jgi:hypothetical protein
MERLIPEKLSPPCRDVDPGSIRWDQIGSIGGYLDTDRSVTGLLLSIARAREWLAFATFI